MHQVCETLAVQCMHCIIYLYFKYQMRQMTNLNFV